MSLIRKVSSLSLLVGVISSGMGCTIEDEMNFERAMLGGFLQTAGAQAPNTWEGAMTSSLGDQMIRDANRQEPVQVNVNNYSQDRNRPKESPGLDLVRRFFRDYKASDGIVDYKIRDSDGDRIIDVDKGEGLDYVARYNCKEDAMFVLLGGRKGYLTSAALVEPETGIEMTLKNEDGEVYEDDNIFRTRSFGLGQFYDFYKQNYPDSYAGEKRFEITLRIQKPGSDDLIDIARRDIKIYFPE